MYDPKMAFQSPGNGEGSSSASPATLSSGLPRANRGYDRQTTDALLGELATKRSELERECAALRAHVAGLEAELARYRAQEQLVSKTLLSATSFAMKTREAVRREAELILSKTSAKALEHNAALERTAREREETERELLRLRQLTEEMQAGLASFLKTTLLQLGPEIEAEQQLEPEVVPNAPAAARVDQALANALQAAIPQETR